MKIKEIYVSSFGNIRDKKFTFGDGINVIQEDNGFGKSTLAAFIKSMLYGFESKRQGGVETGTKAYIPWDGKGAFGGRLTFEHEGKVYVVERTFGNAGKEEKSIVTDTATGKQDLANKLGESFVNLNADSFIRCFYVPQEAVAVTSNDELSAKLSGMIDGDDNGYERAMKILTERSRAFIPVKEKDVKGINAELNGKIRKEEDALRIAKEKAAQLSFSEEQIKKDSELLKKNEADKTAAEEKIDKLNNYIAANSNSEEQTKLLKERAEIKARLNAVDGERLEQDCEELIKLPIKKELKRSVWLPIASGLLALAGLAAAIFWAQMRILGIVAGVMGAALAAVVLIRSYLAKKHCSDVKKRAEELISHHMQVSENLGECKDRIYELREIYRQDKARYDAYNELAASSVKDLSREKDERDLLIKEKNNFEAEIKRLTSKIGENKGHIAELSQSESVADAADRLEELKNCLAEEKRKYEVVNLAAKMLTEAKDGLSGEYIPKLTKRTGELLCEATGGRLTDVIVDDRFHIKITERGQTHDSEYYSRGIREITALCLRLSLGELLCKGNIPFLLIDDAFVNFDENNFERVCSLLKNYSRTTQIIYFSCHDRAEKLKNEYRL